MNNHKTKFDIIIQTLREAIIAGKIKQGQKLRQNVLAKEFQTSPTPVREALRSLQQEGLLTYFPNKGVRVAGLNPQDIFHIFLIRSVLEGLASRIASKNLREGDLRKIEDLQFSMEQALKVDDLKTLAGLNHKFHAILHSSSGIPRLHEMISKLWLVSPLDILWVVPGRAKDSLEEHRNIIAALKGRDGLLAERLMKIHVENASASYVTFLKKKRKSNSKKTVLATRRANCPSI